MIVSELSRQSRHRRHGPPRSPRAFNAARARRFVEEGQYRKASQALTTHGLADPNEDSLEAMLQKHPQVPSPDLPILRPHLSPSLWLRELSHPSLQALLLGRPASEPVIWLKPFPVPPLAVPKLLSLLFRSSLPSSPQGTSLLRLCLTSVEPQFWPERRMGVSAQLPLVKLWVGWFQSAWPSRYATRQPPLSSGCWYQRRC